MKGILANRLDGWVGDFDLKGYLDYAIKSRYKILPPTVFHFPITYKCNGRCVMCNIWKVKKKDMSLEEIQLILKSRIFDTINTVIITGGEPFLRKDMVSIIDIMVKKFPNLVTIGITTNGSLPERIKNCCEKLLKLSNKINFSLSISIDGVGDINDKVRGVSGFFKKAERTIEILQDINRTHENKIDISVQTTVTSFNISGVEDIKRWCKYRNLDWSVALAEERKRNVNEKMKEIFMLNNQQMAEFAKILQQEIEENPDNYFYYMLYQILAKNKARPHICTFLMEAISIDADGKVYICPESKSLGDATIKDPYEIYFNPNNVDYKKEVKKTLCKSCLQGCMWRNGIHKQPFRYIPFLIKGKLKRVVKKNETKNVPSKK